MGLTDISTCDKHIEKCIQALLRSIDISYLLLFFAVDTGLILHVSDDR